MDIKFLYGNKITRMITSFTWDSKVEELTTMLTLKVDSMFVDNGLHETCQNIMYRLQIDVSRIGFIKAHL